MYNFLYYLGLFMVGYVGLTVSLYILSLRVEGAGFYARCLAAYASLVFCSWYGVFASILLRLFGNVRLAQWATARCAKYVMRFTTGVTFEIEDPHNYLGTMRPSVIIGNHQTELDILALGYIFPRYCSVSAKKSLKNVPILGWYMSLSGTVFIDRANSSNARHAMAGASEEITREKQCVFMFPEGTRSYAKEPVLLPFKKGAFHLAVQAGVPIVPVVIGNYSNVLYVQGRIFKSGVIPIKVLKPIETKNLTPADVEDLTRDTRESMLRELVNITAKARGHSISMPAQNLGDGVVKASGAEATLS